MGVLPGSGMKTTRSASAIISYSMCVAPATFPLIGRFHSGNPLAASRACSTTFKAKAENVVLQARDAANGLPLWKRPIKGKVAGATHIEYEMIADADRVVFIPEPGKTPISLDAATGKEQFAYDI